MTVATKKIAKQALALPESERARLAQLLMKSLEAPGEEIDPKEWEKVWNIELKKRIGDIRSGKVKAVPAAQVMRELRAKYG